MPGDVELWPNLTGGEAIDLLGRLRGGLDPARRTELLERFDLDPRKKALFEELCAQEDQTPSQVVRRLIREYIEKRTGRPGQSTT